MGVHLVLFEGLSAHQDQTQTSLHLVLSPSQHQGQVTPPPPSPFPAVALQQGVNEEGSAADQEQSQPSLNLVLSPSQHIGQDVHPSTLTRDEDDQVGVAATQQGAQGLGDTITQTPSPTPAQNHPAVPRQFVPPTPPPLPAPFVAGQFGVDARQEHPIPENLPSIDVVHTTYIPTITWVPKAARPEFSRVLASVCNRVTFNHENSSV